MLDSHSVKLSSSQTLSSPTKATHEGLATFKRPSPDVTPRTDVVTTAVASSAAAPLFVPPKLTPPSRVSYSEFSLIHVFDEMHASGKTMLASFTSSISQGSAKLRQLLLENIEKLKEAAKKAQENGFWSMLQKIGECILAAISTILGITLVATGAGAIVGGVLIAAGILTITNFAMRETGSWDWAAKKLSNDKEQQKKLAIYLPLGVGLVAAVLGLGGSIATALWTSLNMAQQALSIGQAALGIYQGFTTVGKGITDAKVLWTQADLIDIEKRTTLERLSFERNSSAMHQMIQVFENAQQSAEQVIDLAAKALKTVAIQA